MSKDFQRLKGMRGIFSVVLCAGLVCSSGMALGAEPPSSSDMVFILRNAKVVKPTAQLRITSLNRHVLILTDRSPTAQDRDCKIDAVLCAKTLLDAYGDQITEVKVLFSRGSDMPATQVVVIPGDVKAYGSHQIELEPFLASIDLVEVPPPPAASGGEQAPASGSSLDLKRAQLKQRIEALKARGTGVKPFEDIWQRITQEVAQHQDKQAAQDMDFLADKLSEQEKTIKAMAGRKTEAHSSPGFQPGALAQPAAGPGRSPRPVDRSLDVESADLERRANEWEAKAALWKSEGRDTAQLQASLLFIHSWIRDPSQRELARKTLSLLDTLTTAPPKK